MLAERYETFDWRNGVYTLRGAREDILKARQEGFSTLWLALYFLDTINNPLTQSIIVAHDAETTERLFKIIHRFYESLPPEKKRPKKYSNKREIEFSDIDSIISVGTAGAVNLGRGGTINNAHLSERAFWRNGGDVELGLLEAVPFDGNVTRETTANGLNEYYEERQEQERGESSFIPRFFGWNLHPEYKIAVPPDFQITEEEAALAKAYALSEEQLAWRRVKAKDLKEKFVQEYPLNAQEAFVSSGNPYFDRAYLFDLLNSLQEARWNPLGGVTIPDAYARVRAAYQKGQLHLWQLPEPGKRYAIGADTAEGLDADDKHDFDSADVGEKETWTQVAHLHGLWDTHEYGLLLAELGAWYNNALLGVERNNHGHAVLNATIHTARYPNVYYHEEYDEHKEKAQRKPGWPTTPKTKYFALDGLATAIDNREIHLRSRLTVQELLTFVKQAGGKAGGEGKSHDDAVTSLAILRQMFATRPAPIYRPTMTFAKAKA